MFLNTAGRRQAFNHAWGLNQKHPPDEGTPGLPEFDTM